MRIEKSEKKVFITSETEDIKEEVQLIVNGGKIVLNGTFNVEELLEGLKELGYKQTINITGTSTGVFGIGNNYLTTPCIKNDFTKTITLN